jgi:serine/threonine protein kinase
VPDADFWVGPPAAPDTYRLITLLGGGGEGEVWQAVLPLSAGGRSTVAVKILRVGVEAGREQRWEQFGHLLRSLSHPGLVRVTAVFTGPLMHRQGRAEPASRASYVVMDHIEGPTLREWCDEHPEATASQRLRMLRMVASALDEMHSGASTQIPVAHGDVKPANIIVRDDGGTVLVDLGLARLTDAAGVSGRSTPYAAPELRNPGAMATPEADRYAFAIATAQVLTGQPPPTGPDGWIDRAALESLLRSNTITARRPMLVRQILEAISAPPEARPRNLQMWLDSAADTLSQVTVNGGQPSSFQPSPPPQRLDPNTERLPAVAAHSATTTRTGPDAPRRRRRWPWAIAVLMVAVLTGAGLTAYVLRPPNGGTALAVGEPELTPAPTTSAAPTSAFTTLSTTPDPTAATGLPTSAQYLVADDPVDRDNRSNNGSEQTGTFSTSGRQYGHAISMGVVCYNKDGGDYWIDYNLARSWSTFTATIGLRDDAPATSTASYTVLLDSKIVANGQLALGTATPINIPVNGGLRLRLKMNNPSPSVKSCTGNPFRTQVVWGDPTLNP